MFAKIVKVLLKEWSSASRAGGGVAGGNREDGTRTPETDDENGEWDDEYDPRAQGKDDFAFLSDMLGPGGLVTLQNYDDFGLEDDEDLKSDPVYNMDLKVSCSHKAQRVPSTDSLTQNIASDSRFQRRLPSTELVIAVSATLGTACWTIGGPVASLATLE